MTTDTLTPELDDRDRALVAERAAAYDRINGPRVGDFVEFADGVIRRVSHVWDNGVQTSDGGSFYLGDGYISFSGGLYPQIPFSSLSETGEKRNASVWIFHHDWAKAHNGVGAEIPFRVFKADRETEPRYCHSCNAMVPGTHWMGADGRHKPPQPALRKRGISHECRECNSAVGRPCWEAGRELAIPHITRQLLGSERY